MAKRTKKTIFLRICALMLTLLMMVPYLPMGIFAATEETDVFVYEELADYVVKTEAKENDGYIGIPVDLAVYFDAESTAVYDTNNYQIQQGHRDIIFYVINWNGERIGQESDVDILSDYIEEGYVVVTVDYKNHEKAKSPDIEHSLAVLKPAYLTASGNGLDVTVRKNYTYFLPAGYRLMRDISYFDVTVHASLGTRNYVLSVWNKYVAGKKYLTINGESVLAEEVDTFEECTDKYGRALDTNFYLDIIYPSQPKEKTPVYVFEATATDRHKNTCSANPERVHFVGFAFSGYTVVNVEHTFTLMQKTFGYFDPYKLHKENGAKSARASIRCIRAYAEELGYGEDYIAVVGISKGSPYPAILGVKNNATMPEYQNYAADPDGNLFEGGENVVQPYMTYPEGHSKAGQTVSSEVTVAYSAAGDGTRWFYEGADGYFKDREFVPMLLSCGVNDEYGMWDQWEGTQQFFADVATEPYLPIGMLDKGHDYPIGYDVDLGYDRYSAMLQFFNYYMKPETETSELVWPNPKQAEEDVNVNYTPDVKFLTSMNVDSVVAGLTVTDSEGNEVEGTWTASELNSRFTFTCNGFDANETYTLTVADGLLTAEGEQADCAETFTFTTEGETSARPIADAMVSSAEPNRVFGSEGTLTVSGSSSNERILFATFETAALAGKNSASLRLIADAAQTVKIYALDGYTVDEATLCYANMPSLAGGVKLGEFTLKVGENDLDLSKMLGKIESETVTLVIRGEEIEGYSYINNFDSYDVFSLGHTVYTNPLRGNSNEDENKPYGNQAIYRTGGSSVANGIATVDGTKALFVTADDGSDRIKIYNVLTDRMLTQSDVGRSFRISFRIKSTVSVTASVGFMQANSVDSYTKNYSTSYYKTPYYSTVALPADTWTTCSFDVTIDETMTAQQIGMLTVQTAKASGVADTQWTYYIDDVVSTEIVPITNVNAKESGKQTLVLVAETVEDPAEKITPDISWYDSTKTDQYLSDANDLWGLLGLTMTNDASTAVAKVEAYLADGTISASYENAANASLFTAGKVFYLTDDIDLGGVNFPGFVEFSGSIDGQGYKITGFKQTHVPYAAARSKHAGFIRNMTATTKGADLFIKNLILEGEGVTLNYTYEAQTSNAVALVGCFTAASKNKITTDPDASLTIENVMVDVDVSFNCSKTGKFAHRAAGILGSCTTTGYSVSLNNVVYEGIVTANVSVSGEATINVGAFVGELTSASSLTNCLNRGYAFTNKGSASTENWLAVESKKPSMTNCIDAVSGYENGEIVYKTFAKADIEGKDGWYLDENYGVIPATIADTMLYNFYHQETVVPDANGKHKIRILGTLESLNLKRLDLEVLVYVGEADENTPDSAFTDISDLIPPQYSVYESIYAAGEIYTAEELGGKYVYGIVLSDIPAGKTVTLRVTPKKVFTNGDVQEMATRSFVADFS